MIDDDAAVTTEVKSSSFLGDISAVCLVDCPETGSVYALIGTGAQVQSILIHSPPGSTSSISQQWMRTLPNNDQVHGIRKYSGRKGIIIVFGLHRCELWSFDTSGFSTLASTGPITDCILDAVGLHDKVALGTAHNTVRIYNTADLTYVHEFSCIDHSLLYSLDLRWTGTASLQVAAGTVFGSVLTWSFGIDDTERERRIEHRLEGHHGSVFGVSIDDDGERLCTASDDRTVRTWCLREGICTGVGYGHRSRVWRVFHISDGVVTSGEDGTIRLWDKTGTQLRTTIDAHRSSAWAVAVHARLGIVISGGEDGDLRLSRLDRNVLRHERRPIPTEIAARDRDVVGVYDASGHVVVVVRHGIVAIADVNGEWRTIFQADNHVEIRDSCLSPSADSIAIVIGKIGLVILSLDGSVRHDIAGSGFFKVWMMSEHLLAFDGRSLRSWRLLGSDRAPLPHSVIDTAGCNISAINIINGNVITGDTRGSLAALNHDTGALLWRKPGEHGRSVIKAIVSLTSAFATMGADGIIRRYDGDAECVAALQSPNALAEYLYVDDNGHLYTAGFNGANNEYIVSSVRGQTTFVAFPHHGPRSATALTVTRPVYEELPSGAQFHYVNQDDDHLHLVTSTYNMMEIGVMGSTRHPFHIRRINDVTILPGRSLFLSVGEDGSARLGRIQPGAAPVCVASSSVHSDRNAIRCLTRVRDGSLIFTGGAKLQLLAFGVYDFTIRQLGRANGAVFNRRGKWFRRSQSDLDAERQSCLDLRFMSIIVADETCPDFVTLVAGSSIGTLTVYRFCRQTSTFSLRSTAASNVHGHHPVLSLAATRHGILSGDTRGRIALWALHDDELCYVTSVEHVHQSGVNCISVLALEDGMVIVTGGDDHALNVLRYDSGTLRSVASLPGGHYAAVTGVVVLPHPEVGFVMFSASPDRHVRVWSWTGDEIQLLRAIRIECADAAALDASVAAGSDLEYNVIVSGQGLQHLYLEVHPHCSTNT